MTNEELKAGQQVACHIDHSPRPFALDMTLRDWFAGQALAGAIEKWLVGSSQDQTIARWAFEIADAMIAEGKKS